MSKPSAAFDEIQPIVKYIVDEMNSNAKGSDAAKMRSFNAFSAVNEIAKWQKLPLIQRIFSSDFPRTAIDQEMSSRSAALILWTLNVRQNGPWDHKPHIRKTFNPRNPKGEQAWHRYDKYDYFYDIWSNIHYGYAGIACGFSQSALLDGAGLEQIGSDILRGKAPSSRPGTSGMRKFDDASDQESISIGISLFTSVSASVSEASVKSAVLSNPSLTKRLYAP